MSPRRREVEVRRVYDDDLPSGSSRRVLVDRLWPRGVAKVDAEWDEWLKDVAPSTELRRWYGHDVDRFAEFDRRYRSELRQSPGSEALDRLATAAADRGLTLLTATRDVDHSAARVLQKVLTRRTARSQ